VRLQHTEILFRELDFYNTAFSSLSTAAALLAGFAFSGLAIALDEGPNRRVRDVLALFCLVTTAINLVALCAATFAAIFSVRLALRGSQGEDNVEQAVRRARQEYKLVLRIFVAGIVGFFASLGVAGYVQMGPIPAALGLFVSSAGLAVVFWLFSRIDTRFNLMPTAASLTAFSIRQRANNSRPASWFGSPTPMGPASVYGSGVVTPYRQAAGSLYHESESSVVAASDSMGRFAIRVDHLKRDESMRGPLLERGREPDCPPDRNGGSAAGWGGNSSARGSKPHLPLAGPDLRGHEGLHSPAPPTEIEDGHDAGHRAWREPEPAVTCTYM